MCCCCCCCVLVFDTSIFVVFVSDAAVNFVVKITNIIAIIAITFVVVFEFKYA